MDVAGVFVDEGASGSSGEAPDAERSDAQDCSLKNTRWQCRKRQEALCRLSLLSCAVCGINVHTGLPDRKGTQRNIPARWWGLRDAASGKRTRRLRYRWFMKAAVPNTRGGP